MFVTNFYNKCYILPILAVYDLADRNWSSKRPYKVQFGRNGEKILEKSDKWRSVKRDSSILVFFRYLAFFQKQLSPLDYLVSTGDC